MLTGKDYKAISAIIAEEHNYQTTVERSFGVDTLQTITGAIADYMTQDNPNFNRDKFIAACNGEK